MLARNAFVYGALLVLSVGATAEMLRADVLDQDGSAAYFIAKPFLPFGPMRQSSAHPHSSLHAHSCDELWYERNAILWSAGYCFHESRAVRVFGNAACGYDRTYEVPLTGGDSLLVRLLEQAEAAKGCPQ
jgi:hypothetical protein